MHRNGQRLAGKTWCVTVFVRLPMNPIPLATELLVASLVDMGKVSAGLLMYRKRAGKVEFLLVHPGGPFWRNKDAGGWTIPKGEIEQGEDALEAAKREFQEEVGLRPTGPFNELPCVQQKGGKVIQAWAFESDFDPAQL